MGVVVSVTVPETQTTVTRCCPSAVDWWEEAFFCCLRPVESDLKRAVLHSSHRPSASAHLTLIRAALLLSLVERLHAVGGR